MLSGIHGKKDRFGTVFSQAIRVGNQLYITGIRSNGPQTRGDPKAQTRTILTTIQNFLKEGGMDFENIVSAHIWLTDSRNFDQVSEVYREFMQGHPALWSDAWGGPDGRGVPRANRDSGRKVKRKFQMEGIS